MLTTHSSNKKKIPLFGPPLFVDTWCKQLSGVVVFSAAVIMKWCMWKMGHRKAYIRFVAFLVPSWESYQTNALPVHLSFCCCRSLGPFSFLANRNHVYNSIYRECLGWSIIHLFLLLFQTSIMAHPLQTPSLAHFKLPAIENEPMVSRSFCVTYMSISFLPVSPPSHITEKLCTWLWRATKTSSSSQGNEWTTSFGSATCYQWWKDQEWQHCSAIQSFWAQEGCMHIPSSWRVTN